jgi:malonyl CoA-acyl carrier protein transacylase
MIEQPVTIESARRYIRWAWQRHILPVYQDRDRDGLIAALVVANTSLDTILQLEGYAGTTYQERLWSARNSVTNYDKVCAARLVRNQAVHQLHRPVCWYAGVAALTAFAQALWEHGVDVGLNCDFRQAA